MVPELPDTDLVLVLHMYVKQQEVGLKKLLLMNAKCRLASFQR